jgi:hypothetical protein
MKTLWNALSFLAIVHLLAILLFTLWLWQSSRLSGERVEAARALFAPTMAQAELAAKEAEREAKERQRQAEDDARRIDPPVSSEVRMQQIARMEDIEQRAVRRMADERGMLFEQLEEATRRIDQREAALEAEKRAWRESVEAERQRRESEQFAKAVRQYESVPARQAKNMLLELVDSGETAQAVAYLDAMNARAASKVLAEFRTDAEIQLATELLERLRTLGVDSPRPVATQEPDHAGNIADAR